MPSQREVLAFIFIFRKVVFLLPPSHKWHHKQTKIMFQITKFTLSDRIYPIECTYIKIEDILLPRQIRRAVKVDEVKNHAPLKDNRFIDEILKTDAFLYFAFFSLFKWICTFSSHY